MVAARTMRAMASGGETEGTRMTLGRHILEPSGSTGVRVANSRRSCCSSPSSERSSRTPCAALHFQASSDRRVKRNVQGEATKKMDVFGNAAIVEAFTCSELVAAIVSEEMDEPRLVTCGIRRPLRSMHRPAGRLVQQRRERRRRHDLWRLRRRATWAP